MMEQGHLFHSNRKEPDRYWFGPAGWSYQDWHGPVYPTGIPSTFNHLQFLARDFDFIEVNTTFYRIPSLKLTSGWVNKTADLTHFTFWIKLLQDFTHKRILDRQAASHFKASIEPLVQANKMAGLLIQFPYSFKPDSDNMAYLSRLQETFQDYLLAIEFRHKNWHNDDVLGLFREKKLIWVNIDQPVISQSLPLTATLTHPDTTYFRLHGRNYEHWFGQSGRDARYDYDYSSAELTSIGEAIKKLGHMAKKIFISGNNHYKGSAVKNLKELKKILNR
jgi:uncharacterized protein YecE (DUF72 family)